MNERAPRVPTRRRCWTPLMGVAVLVAAAVAGPGSASAQYKQQETKVAVREAKQLMPKVGAIVRNAGIAALSEKDKGELDNYFDGYLLPGMSQYEPADLGRLAKDREDLFRRHIDAAKSPVVRKYLIDKTIKWMGAYSIGNYHPAVRYNAVLVLAGLDAEPAAGGVNPKPPVPLPAGTNALLLLLEKERIQNVIVPSSVKVGALVGLERHARFGINPQLTERLEKACMAVIDQPEHPGDISDGVHDWMKCLALRVLTKQHVDDADADVHNAITRLVADNSVDLSDRCCAARQFAKMKYPGSSGLDAGAAVLALGALTKDIVASEGEKAEDYEAEVLGDAPGGGFSAPRGGGFGGGYGGEFGGEGGYGGEFRGGYGGGFGGGLQDTGPRYEKRRMLEYILSVVEAIKAIKPAADQENQTRIDSLASLLQEVADKASDKDALDIDIIQDVMRLRTQVIPLVNGWNPEQPEPVEEAPDDQF